MGTSPDQKLWSWSTYLRDHSLNKPLEKPLPFPDVIDVLSAALVLAAAIGVFQEQIIDFITRFRSL